ncbi:Acetyl-coa carboxylase, biotin carboxylase subunit [Globisporangium polare]
MRLFRPTARAAQLLRAATTRRLLSSDAAPRSFRKILIANRGEIALRVIRSAQKLNIETVAVYSDADVNSQHVKQATEAYRLGPAPANESYLNYEKILEICKLSGAEAVHPGYGFLSENAFFARACADANIEFIGPPVKAIEAMGSKSASKDIMIAAGVPVTPGYHGADQTFETLQAEARKIGYPVLIKAVLGGGGKGMRIVDDEKDLMENLEACQREGKASFGDARVLIEKYLRKPRHVELQVFGDKFGNVVHLFERDCSVQRRHQKVLEEAPAPHMTEALRKKMGDAAVAAAKAVGYVGAGTVEFLLDEDESFYFMEMNTRLQVEHPVTELITKQDLVELQLKVAAGQELPIKQEDLKIHGHAIEARIYAENPYNNFLPGSGKLQHVRLPPASDTVRVDTGIIEGDEVSIFYDPMIAKLIVHGKNRQEALDSLIKALHQYQIVGLPTNIEFVARTANHPEFRKGGVDTSFLNKFGDEVLEPLGKFPVHAKALGAVSLLLFEQLESYPLADFNGELNSPWSDDSLKHFRSLETLERKFQLNHEGSRVTVGAKCHASDTYELTFTDENDEQVTVHAKGEISPSGDFEIRVDNRKFKGTAVVHKQDVHIFCDDGTQRYEYKFNVPLPSLEAAEGSASSGHSKIVTPMPGKIIKVLVKSGESIKQEQPLLIMEAMKMEHVIRATKDGKVEDVFCEEGDFVSDGHVLIELD